ncbi:RING-type E3 ubiquitin transferase [Salvia divinorum]|uniref:RING-type E3 ubiquitin transferase n=1 Tax=Salvia divinorum TaxID=28513 RepID=A0ABD1GPP9_SALDI
MNSTSHGLDTKPLGGSGYTLGLCIGLSIVLLVVTYVSYTCKHARDEATHNHQSMVMNGLDESTLSSYPQITYSDAKAGDTCSVCLADYATGDLLRLLPDCGHLFHLTHHQLFRVFICPDCPEKDKKLPATGQASPPAQLLTLKLPFSPIQSNPSTVLRLLQLLHWRRHRRHSRPRRPFFQRRGFTVAIAFLAARRCRLYRVRPGHPPSPCVSAPTGSALGGLRFT